MLKTPGVHAAAVVFTALATLAGAATQQAAGPDDVEDVKQTLLDRISQLQRMPLEYRGDRDRQRVKWEWYDESIYLYQFVKDQILAEQSSGKEHAVREQWAFRDMTLTFQELFPLPAADADKLVPILSHVEILRKAPAATWEGLILRGKDGEVKGPITRLYATRAGAGDTAIISGAFRFGLALEYRDKKGELQRAGGMTYDAFNILWADIKDRVAIDMSEAKAAETRQMLRDAR